MAWLVDYHDAAGVRRTKQFSRKKDADSFHATASHEVRLGTHVADAATVTVAEAGAQWIAQGEADGLERSSIAQRRQHLHFHIKPFIGDVKLTKLKIDVIRKFQNDLRSSGRSHDMIKRVTTSLGGILAEAQERRLVASNPVRDMRKRRTTAEKRQKKRLEIGVDIPTPDEIRRLLAASRTVAMKAWQSFKPSDLSCNDDYCPLSCGAGEKTKRPVLPAWLAVKAFAGCVFPQASARSDSSAVV